MNNKKGNAVAIVIVVLAIIVCIVGTIFYLKKDKENIETGGGDIVKLDPIEKQLSLIKDNVSMWKDSDGYERFQYAVTDLDHNGRLEIIAASCQGTGLYTYSNYYEVNETMDALNKVTTNYEEGDSEPDIIVDRAKVYYDASNNEYHYIFTDLCKNGAAEYYESVNDVVLKEGKLTRSVLATKATIYENEKATITCKDSNENSITEEEYENVAEKTFGNLTSKTISLSWIEGDDENFNINLDKLLKDSYANFGLEVKEDTDAKARRLAYKKVMQGFIENKTWPDGTKLATDDIYDFSENLFAIADFDNDGKEELLVNYSSTFMAGMIGVMYDYDSETDQVVKELSDVFPTLDIYDNGVIKVSASHNQGLAGDKLWPYEVYKYDASTDTYKYFAMVDAWDKSLSEKDYEGNTFPDDVDKDKVGVVYYVTEGENAEKKAISQKDYEKWDEELIGGANKLEIDYKKFTKENVDSI